MRLAHQEAERLDHPYLGVEHVLIGLMEEGDGIAAHVLRDLGADLEKGRAEMATLAPPGTEPVDKFGILPTPKAKQFVVHAMDEARALNHHYVGTEHLLLALSCEQDGVAAQMLANLELDPKALREEALNILGHGI